MDLWLCLFIVIFPLARAANVVLQEGETLDPLLFLH